MKKRLISVTIITLAGLLVTGGILWAATRHNVTATLGGVDGDYFDLDGNFSVQSITVGSQGTGGVTFFNGTIVNSTTDGSGNGISVTFGDDVRIDGVLHRGATAGKGDSLPVKIDDDVIIYGTSTLDDNLTVAGTGTLSKAVPTTGGAVLTASQTSTEAATANRSALTLATTGTSAFDYLVYSTNFTVNQAGLGYFAGGANIASGQTYQVDGTQISSDNLSDVASISMLDEAETITGDWVNTANPWGADEIANIERQIELPLESFLNVTTFGEIVEASAATDPVIALNNSVPSIVWADADTDWIAQTFVVPPDYALSGYFEVVAAEATGTATDVGVDFDVYINQDNAAWDAAATDQTRVDVGASALPQTLTLTVATDFDSLTAGDAVTLRLTRADGGVGAESLELYNVKFVYTATQ